MSVALIALGTPGIRSRIVPVIGRSFQAAVSICYATFSINSPKIVVVRLLCRRNDNLFMDAQWRSWTGMGEENVHRIQS